MKFARLLLPLLALGSLAHGHIGSPDIYLEGQAGPYRLFVTVRPPLTIPGVAELEVRSENQGVREVRAVPLAVKGAGAKFAPTPDLLKLSPKDAQFFTGSLWMMTSGSWQARITVDGSEGTGTLSVPIPSVARASMRMQLGLGALLSVLGLFLFSGLVAIIGAASREARLDPGVKPAEADLTRGRKALIFGAILLLAIVLGGNSWWNSEADAYATRIYKPLQMSAAFNANLLTLQIREPGWMQPPNIRIPTSLFVRKLDDLIPDHGHIMHLYLLRQPGLDQIYHLHPDQGENNRFDLRLPTMAAGKYKLYADIVHSNGFPETLTSEIDLPALDGRALSGDDSSASAKPWQDGSSNEAVFTLPDGYKMEWLRSNKPLLAAEPMAFSFRLTKPDGSTPSDMALYMGMLGHAAFVKTDGTVFAHIHPNGTVSMAALMLASGMPADMNHSAMEMGDAIPNTVSFPYGFPTAGRYRVIVQMKHGATVESGVFDATVAPPNPAGK